VSEPARRVREIVTPEGVPLRFALADVGDRLGAFAIDCTLVILVAAVVAIAAAIAAAAARGLGVAAGLLAFFALRSFYFAWFECHAAGATPGKRLLGLRVIDAHGGMLSAEAVFARNFMREIELFVPLSFVLVPDSVLPGRSAMARLAAGLWLGILALLPLFNRDRLRAGDLVAGTLVVHTPKAILLDDLSAPRVDRRAPAGEIAFTAAQLDQYGIRELQVLEDLLRHGSARTRALEAVAKKIQDRIGWTPPARPIDHRSFLQAFYTAQRARLEERMLLGERRESKRTRAASRTP
jgi:uncharacterized RDD family membrane protein YckC